MIPPRIYLHGKALDRAEESAAEWARKRRELLYADLQATDESEQRLRQSVNRWLLYFVIFAMGVGVGVSFFALFSHLN